MYIFDETSIGFGGGKVPFISIYFLMPLAGTIAERRETYCHSRESKEEQCTQSTKGVVWVGWEVVVVVWSEWLCLDFVTLRD